MPDEDPETIGKAASSSGGDDPAADPATDGAKSEEDKKSGVDEDDGKSASGSSKKSDRSGKSVKSGKSGTKTAADNSVGDKAAPNSDGSPDPKSEGKSELKSDVKSADGGKSDAKSGKSDAKSSKEDDVDNASDETPDREPLQEEKKTEAEKKAPSKTVPLKPIEVKKDKVDKPDADRDSDSDGRDSEEEESDFGSTSSSFDYERKTYDPKKSQLAKYPYPRVPWVKRASLIPEEEDAHLIEVTRGDLLGFLNTLVWFREACMTIPFTLALWGLFLVLLGIHGDVELSYQVRASIESGIESVNGHPALGNTATGSGDGLRMLPVECKCLAAPKEQGLSNVCEVVGTNRQKFNIKGVLNQKLFQDYEITPEYHIGYGDQGNAATGGYKTYSREYALQQMLKEKYANNRMYGIVTFQDIRDVQSIFFWLQHGLLPSLWHEDEVIQTTENDPSIMNQLEGSSDIISSTTLLRKLGIDALDFDDYISSILEADSLVVARREQGKKNANVKLDLLCAGLDAEEVTLLGTKIMYDVHSDMNHVFKHDRKQLLACWQQRVYEEGLRVLESNQRAMGRNPEKESQIKEIGLEREEIHSINPFSESYDYEPSLPSRSWNNNSWGKRLLSIIPAEMDWNVNIFTGFSNLYSKVTTMIYGSDVNHKDHYRRRRGKMLDQWRKYGVDVEDIVERKILEEEEEKNTIDRTKLRITNHNLDRSLQTGTTVTTTTTMITATTSSTGGTNTTDTTETQAQKNLKKGADRPGRLHLTNQLIGGVRLRQFRLEEGDCGVSTELSKFYGKDCRESGASTSPIPSPTNHICFQPASSTDDSADDGYFDCYWHVDHVLTIANGALEDIEHYLMPDQWINNPTEYVELQMAFFNAESRLYSLVKIRFSLQVGGFLEKSIDVVAISANIYPNIWYLIPDIIFLGMIGFLFRQEGWEVINAKREGFLRDYISDFWNALDWLSIFCGIAIAMFWFQLVIATNNLGDKVSQLGPAPPTVEQARLEKYHLKWGEIIEDLDDQAFAQEVQFLFLFWYTLILMLRFFKSFQGQPRLSQISNTLLTSILDVAHFLIIFFVVFLNFSIGGNVLFGTLNEEWRTIMHSINTAIMALLGDIDMHSLVKTSGLTAYLWFWCFMISCWYILLNLLIAIVFDHYIIVKETVGETQGLGSQIMEVFFEMSWNLDWYCQRRRYIKEGVVEPEPFKILRFLPPEKLKWLILDKQKSVEEIYEVMRRDTPEGLKYGRQTILQQKIEKRAAQRQIFELGLTFEKVEAPAERRKSISKALKESADPTATAASIANSMRLSRTLGGEESGSKGVTASKESFAPMLGSKSVTASKESSKASKMIVRSQQLEAIREKLDVTDLEDMGVEPRFARHLMVRCQRYVESEMDFTEARKNEMKVLVESCETFMKHLKVDLRIVEASMSTIVSLSHINNLEIEKKVEKVHKELVNKQRTVGILPGKGIMMNKELGYSEIHYNNGRFVDGIPTKGESTENAKNTNKRNRRAYRPSTQ